MTFIKHYRCNDGMSRMKMIKIVQRNSRYRRYSKTIVWFSNSLRNVLYVTNCTIQFNTKVLVIDFENNIQHCRVAPFNKFFDKLRNLSNFASKYFFLHYYFSAMFRTWTCRFKWFSSIFSKFSAANKMWLCS